MKKSLSIVNVDILYLVDLTTDLHISIYSYCMEMVFLFTFETRKDMNPRSGRKAKRSNI